MGNFYVKRDTIYVKCKMIAWNIWYSLFRFWINWLQFGQIQEHYSSEKDGSHIMVATKIKHKDGIECIQLKNSFADNSNEQGTVQSMKFII